MAPDERDERFDAVFGHLQFGEHSKFKRRCVYISATRDPVARICSFYNFLHLNPEHHAHQHVRRNLCDLNDFDESNADDEILKKLWSDAFVRVYGGGAYYNRNGYNKTRNKIIKQVKDLQLFAAPLSEVEAFLRQVGVITEDLPRLNVTDTSVSDGFEPADPKTLKPEVRDLIIESFCENDYDILELIEINRPLDGVEFAQEVGLGESWLA